MITGLSRPQQILYFFENHKEELYSTYYISQYICNNFDLTNKPLPKNITMLQQINNEVSSNISKFMDPKYNVRTPINFDRIEKDNRIFLYRYNENVNISLPTPKTVEKTNIYKTTKILKPTQTSFDFDEIEDETEQEISISDKECEEVSISPLMEDVVAYDHVYSISDPVLCLLEKLESVNLQNLQENKLVFTYEKRKVTIIIENF